MAEWLEWHAGKEGVTGSIPRRCTYFRIIFRQLPVAYSSTKAIQNEVRSMTFIKSILVQRDRFIIK